MVVSVVVCEMSKPDINDRVILRFVGVEMWGADFAHLVAVGHD